MIWNNIETSKRISLQTFDMLYDLLLWKVEQNSLLITKAFTENILLNKQSLKDQ
jgi:hypothetical protein